jgi:hypothetical protein
MAQIFPTSYFGNLSYYAALIQEPSIVIEAKEHFIKQTYRNRCEVLTGNGVQAISIPVIRKNGSKTSIDEVEISNDTDWRKDHWKAIESAYSNSPYFDHYGLEVKELIYNQETNLLKFNEQIHKRICTWLGIATDYKFSNEYSSISESTYQFKEKELIKPYIQVFGDSNSFATNLSILDAIFCLGPMARKLIVN